MNLKRIKVSVQEDLKEESDEGLDSERKDSIP